MIELYRAENSAFADKIESALKEMVVAHKVTVLKGRKTVTLLEREVPLPALKENDQLVTGETAIKNFLRVLEKDMARWQLFQSDACYVDEDMC